MRLAHLADLHTNLRSRAEEWRRISQWILGDLHTQKPDVITLGGDLFEDSPTPADEDSTGEWLLELADIAPVVGVTGNHDIGCPTIPRRRLPVTAYQEPRHPIQILDRPGIVDAAGAIIAGLPWPRGGHVLAATKGATPEERHLAGVAGMRALLTGFGAEVTAHDGPRVLLAHCHVRGVKLGAHIPDRVDFEVGIEDLALAGADFCGLGHIHQHQAWSWRRDGRDMVAVYPGSPYRTAWGETEAKGYVIAELDAGGLREWRFVETPATPMVLEAWQWDAEGFFVRAGRQLHESDFGGLVGAEVRFRYEHDKDQAQAAKRGAEQLAAWMVRERGALRVALDPDPRTVVRARMPEITAQKSAADKLALLLAGQGIEAGRVERLRAMTADLERTES